MNLTTSAADEARRATRAGRIAATSLAAARRHAANGNRDCLIGEIRTAELAADDALHAARLAALAVAESGEGGLHVGTACRAASRAVQRALAAAMLVQQ